MYSIDYPSFYFIFDGLRGLHSLVENTTMNMRHCIETCITDILPVGPSGPSGPGKPGGPGGPEKNK